MGIRAGLGPRLGGGIREQSEIGLGASVVGVGWGREARRKGLDWVGKKGEERRRRNSRREGERERERESKVEDEQEREREREISFHFWLLQIWCGSLPPPLRNQSWVYVFSVLLIRSTYSHDFFLLVYVCMYL